MNRGLTPIFTMSDILERILATKRAEVEQARQRRPLAELQRAAAGRDDGRDFVGALRAKLERQQPAVIAEVKKASREGRPACDSTRVDRCQLRGHGAACLWC
jgi:indole-3-glycerol phosphate synthase